MGRGARFVSPAAPARASREAIMGKPLNDNGFELTTDGADCTDNYAEPIAVEGVEWGMGNGDFAGATTMSLKWIGKWLNLGMARRLVSPKAWRRRKLWPRRGARFLGEPAPPCGKKAKVCVCNYVGLSHLQNWR